MKITLNNIKLYIDNIVALDDEDEEEVFEDPRCEELWQLRKKYLKAIEDICDSIDYHLSYVFDDQSVYDSFEELLSFDEDVASIDAALTEFRELASKALYPEED